MGGGKVGAGVAVGAGSSQAVAPANSAEAIKAISNAFILPLNSNLET